MKKLLLSLGALSAVVAPVAAVVACGSTDSDSTSFEVATDAQATALKDLSETIGNNVDVLDLGSDFTLTKTEVAGTDVRFTYTPSSTDGFDDITRITVSLDSKEITKLERQVDGDFHNNTSATTDLAIFNQSNHQDFADAATALEAAVNSPNTTTNVAKQILDVQIATDTTSIAKAKTDKEVSKKEIRDTALAALAKIDATSTDKLELVNAVVEEFIEAEGSGVAFGQKNQGKQFTFKADGSFNWTQVDTGNDGKGIDYSDFDTFAKRAPVDSDSYEGMQNDVLKAAIAKLKATA